MAGDLAVTGELELAGTAVGASIAPLQSALASTQAAGEGMPQRLDTLERTVASLVELVGAVVIRAGTTRTEVEQGDDDLGMLGISRCR